MKGFMITLSLIAVAVIILINQYEKIGLKYYEYLLTQEGGQAGRAAFESMKSAEPEAFKKKYQKILDKRCRLAFVAYYLGSSELFGRVARETKELYLNSSVEHHERFGKMMLFLADWFEEKKQDFEAYTHLKEFLQMFPNHSAVRRAQQAANRLQIRHHFQ